MLYKVVLPFKSLEEPLASDHQIKAIERYLQRGSLLSDFLFPLLQMYLCVITLCSFK